MRLYHIKDLLNKIEDIEWIAEALNIDKKQYPEFDSEILRNKFWKFLEEKKLKDKFKIYIGEWK
jgi:hypothetical protein